MNDSARSTEAGVAGDQRLGTWLGVVIAVLLVGFGVVLYRILIRILGFEPTFAAKITHQAASAGNAHDSATGAHAYAEAVAATAESVHGFDEQSEKISKVVDVIREIANQTN